MGSKAFDDIMGGLVDALSFVRGDIGKGRETIVDVPAVDVRAAPNRLGLSQPDFAAAFGVSVATVRNWEQLRRRPKGAARVLLSLIDRNPSAVVDVFRDLRNQQAGDLA